MKAMVSLLDERYRLLKERERDLHDQKEELQAQKEELTAAIEELVSKNNSLASALENLQQRNTELDQVLYRASHDLKTPVSSLYGLLNALKAEGLTESQSELHVRMQEKVDQMNDLLKSLTQLAKASFEEVQPDRFFFQDVFHQVVKDLVHLPNFRNVKIILTPESYCEITSDRQLVVIALRALMANALTFRNDGPGKISVYCSAEEGQIRIEVQDDGEGIDPMIAARIFDIFFRGSEKSKGSGLGLYIVLTIVKRLQGKVNFESNPGKTMFQIILPELPL